MYSSFSVVVPACCQKGTLPPYGLENECGLLMRAGLEPPAPTTARSIAAASDRTVDAANARRRQAVAIAWQANRLLKANIKSTYGNVPCQLLGGS
jgi:hypothetical protein